MHAQSGAGLPSRASPRRHPLAPTRARERALEPFALPSDTASIKCIWMLGARRGCAPVCVAVGVRHAGAAAERGESAKSDLGQAQRLSQPSRGKRPSCSALSRRTSARSLDPRAYTQAQVGRAIARAREAFPTPASDSTDAGLPDKTAMQSECGLPGSPVAFPRRAGWVRLSRAGSTSGAVRAGRRVGAASEAS